MLQKKLVGILAAIGCVSLTSLKGAPKEIGGDFYCHFCASLTSLKDIHKIIKKMNGAFRIIGCTGIKSHILGLLLIEGCTELEMDNKDVEKIMNKYLNEPFTPHRLYDCQDVLIEAGFEEYAQL